MPYIQTDNPAFVRETESSGLVNRDSVGLSRTRTARKKAVVLKETNSQLQAKVCELTDRLNDTDARLLELQLTLVRLVKHTPTGL